MVDRNEEKNPDLIEIIQHGYNHSLNYCQKVGRKTKKGEFGGNRTYNEQYRDIVAGKKMMDDHFGELWFPAFTTPFGARNKSTLRALNDAGFVVLNGGIGVGLNYKLFYFLGRLLDREMIFNRKISYNLKYRRGTKLFQIDVALSLIKKYHNEETDCDFYDLTNLKIMTQKLLQLPNLGVLLHHRYHTDNESLSLIDKYLRWLKSLKVLQFATQKQIFETLG